MKMCCAIVGLVLLAGPIAVAQDEDFEPVLRAGPGFVLSGKPYDGYDREVFPIGIVFYESQTWSVRGTEVGYRLFNNGELDFKAIARCPLSPAIHAPDMRSAMTSVT